MALRGPGGEPPYTARGRWPPTGLPEVAGLRAKAAGLGLSLRAARPLAANLNVDGNRSSHMPAGDAVVAGGRRTARQVPGSGVLRCGDGYR